MDQSEFLIVILFYFITRSSLQIQYLLFEVEKKYRSKKYSNFFPILCLKFLRLINSYFGTMLVLISIGETLSPWDKHRLGEENIICNSYAILCI